MRSLTQALADSIVNPCAARVTVLATVALLCTPRTEHAQVVQVSGVSFPKTAAKPYFDNGYGVAHVGYVNDRWYLTLRPDGSGYVSDTVWPREKIRNLWRTSFITDVTYGAGYFVVAHKVKTRVPITRQEYSYARVFPRAFVDSMWKEGMHITSLVYGKGRYYVVMSANSGYTRQAWHGERELPRAYIKDAWNQGYRITDLEFAEGRWLVIMSQGPRPGQSYRTSRIWPQAQVDSFARAGYELTDAAYGDSTYLLIFTKAPPARPPQRVADARSSRAPGMSAPSATSSVARQRQLADAEYRRRQAERDRQDRIDDVEDQIEQAELRAEREEEHAIDLRDKARQLRDQARGDNGGGRVIALTGAQLFENQARDADRNARSARSEARRLRSRLATLTNQRVYVELESPAAPQPNSAPERTPTIQDELNRQLKGIEKAGRAGEDARTARANMRGSATGGSAGAGVSGSAPVRADPPGSVAPIRQQGELPGYCLVGYTQYGSHWHYKTQADAIKACEKESGRRCVKYKEPEGTRLAC